MSSIKELAEKYESYIIDRRRYLHQYPELSFEEKETTATIVKELTEMGMEVITFPDYYGCIGVLKGGEGPTVMLRADIDALPVTEHTGLEFCSKTEGKMHACGHDAHISMLLGAAKILCEKKDELKGTVKFLFQSAEESCYGAKYYNEKGYLEGVSGIFGMHIWNDVEVPYINIQGGDRMASADNFKITIHGTSAHGSAPQNGHDALVAAAATVMNLQTYVSRSNSPLNPLVITIGTIRGGERFNIIANKVEMEGTVRTYAKGVRSRVEPDMREIVKHTAATFGCTAEVEYGYYCAAIVNEDEDMVRIAREAVTKLYGAETLVPLSKMMGSEDFAYLTEKVPGLYGFIGSHNEAKGTIYGNHNDRYTVDEDMLKRGAATYAQFAYDFLEEKSC